MKLVRPALPKTRRGKLTDRLRNNLVGKLVTRKFFGQGPRQHQFVMWLAHSRFIWWKFYR